MMEEITKEQWDAMTPAEVTRWINWAMPQGAESPLPEDQAGIYEEIRSRMKLGK